MKIRTAPVALGLYALLFSVVPLRAADTATPIKHVVVIFDENNAFDHYFGTYPNAANPPGEPQFTALPNTPAVNGLTPALLANNPNSTGPFRLDRSKQDLCDND